MRGGDKAMRSAQKRTAARTARCQNAGCRKEFTVTRKWRKYCRPQCRQAAYFERRLVKAKTLSAQCPRCGHEFPIQIAAVA